MTAAPAPDGRPPLRRWPMGALVGYAVACALLYLGRWWIAGVVERARGGEETLPGLMIVAAEALTGPGWILTVGLVGGLLAAALARHLDGASRAGIGGGLALYGAIIWLISGDVGRAANAGGVAVSILGWVGRAAALWTPALGLSAIRIIEAFVRFRRSRRRD